MEQNDIRAFSLYMSSAEQGNPYASLELAKMYRDGFGTEPDLQQAEWRFQNAYSGFVVLEEKSHDDKLQYRIGQMLHTGTGTSKDDEGAARYWEKSAKLGISMLSMHLEHSGWKREVETAARQWNGLQSSKCRALSCPVCVGEIIPGWCVF